MEPCAPWGRATEANAVLANAQGTLTVTLGTGQAAQGLCTAFLSAQLGPDGALLELGSSSAAANAYVTLGVTPESRGEINAQLLVRASSIHLLQDGAVVATRPIDPLTVRSLRLRPEPGSSAMRGEARIAESWQLIGTITGAAPGPAFLMFGAGTIAAETEPSTTSFASVRMCSPSP